MLDLGQYVPYLLNRAGRRVADAFTRELGGFGVTLPMWRVMTSLRSEGPQRRGDLSDLTAIEASTLSRLLGQMEASGLVRRARSRGDARAITVSLTRRAAALTGRIVPLALRYEQAALAGMSDAEVAILKRLLGRMQENVAGWREDKRAG